MQNSSNPLFSAIAEEDIMKQQRQGSAATADRTACWISLVFLEKRQADTHRPATISLQQALPWSSAHHTVFIQTCFRCK